MDLDRDGGGEEEREVRLVTEVFQWLSNRKIEEESVVAGDEVEMTKKRNVTGRGVSGGLFRRMRWCLVELMAEGRE
ncbi:hypothetical protein HAX54_034242 [Datura stramonium]|uniref:Uncharacterized protein n=1 Tax=Datura stramonium TaxID=4076 RepID=A0ABS8SE24_DATST|nr:hypothetical protein [Datura stramonium]